jgi:hypothetical protein
MLSLGEGIVALRIKPNVFVMSSTPGRAVADAKRAPYRDTLRTAYDSVRKLTPHAAQRDHDRVELLGWRELHERSARS